MTKEKVMCIFTFLIFLFPLISPAPCDLAVKLINQDPYPAIPGDYVKVVFQIDGVANPECGIIEFELVPKYPISFDPTEKSIITINAGLYSKDYSSFLLAPYKVRVDADAIEGENPIETRYRYGGNQGYESNDFTLNIENTFAEFEVFVKDYDPLTKELVFEILNTADADIKALTIEVPPQETIKIQGANTNIVGDLDSNEYTTAEFTAIPEEGEIKIKLSYTDKINKRRTIEEVVAFNPEYFYIAESGTSTFTKIIILLVIVAIGYFSYKKFRKHKEHRK